jgi:hypothetical protein
MEREKRLKEAEEILEKETRMKRSVESGDGTGSELATIISGTSASEGWNDAAVS